jgi:hypothetical protein
MAKKTPTESTELDTPEQADAEAPKLKQPATIEDWQEKNKPPLWLHLAAKAGKGWPIGAEVSEELYLAALKEAGNVTIGH